MAYAAVASLMLTLQQILQHPQRCSIPCDREHVESFQKKLQFLRLFLEEHPSTKSNEQVSSLERRIRDAAYEADDFFMDGHLIVSRRSSSLVRTIRDVAYEADEFFMDGHLIVSRRSSSKEKMGQVNIEVMMKNVDSMIEEVRKIKGQIGLEIIRGRGPSMELEGIKIGEVRNHGDFQHRSALRKDSSGLVSSDRNNLMVGFDSHLVQIKDQITGQSSALEVVSIVGMGGIGKSTLATHVYNDPYVVNHFDVRAWATVSQSYDVREILLDMLDSMKILTEEMHRESDDQLGLHVYQNLKHRRYLVIIDDIWDTDAWDYLKMKFPDDENGSRIMLTTRIADVAAYASPSETLHQISLLSDDQSWELLCAKVFGDEPCPLSLQEIGKTIAQSCGGLPLSIVVIGGLLSKVEKTQMAWQPVAENVTSFVFSSDDRCSDILRLSYNYLPHYLKPCFLYLGVFPKAYEICVSKLIQMWVAEGFLRLVHGQSLEEVAESCIQDLLDRSLILMSKQDYQGKINVFRIHDLLFDFCLKEAKDEKFLLVTPRTSACEHRISIHSMEEFKHCQSHLDSMSSPCYVHSLFVFKLSYFSLLLPRFKLLRVLDATKVMFLKFTQVLELLNLRYLALVYHGNVPASITKLWYLQTLIITQNSRGEGKSYLPVEIWMMVHLRHVRHNGVCLPDPSAGKFNFHKKDMILENLQTLSGLENLKFSEEMLQSIPNIKKIDVFYNDSCLRGKEWSYYGFENLGNLQHLKALKIRASVNLLGYLNLTTPSFRFPPSLKTLTLSGVGIPWLSLATIGSLPNLEVLKLKNLACLGTEWETNEGEFCELKVLVLQLLGLKHWKAYSEHFPSLQRLIIRECDNLLGIPSGIGEIPTLDTIVLSTYDASLLASANEILEKQLSNGNDGFQVIKADPKTISSSQRAHRLREVMRVKTELRRRYYYNGF